MFFKFPSRFPRNPNTFLSTCLFKTEYGIQIIENGVLMAIITSYLKSRALFCFIFKYLYFHYLLQLIFPRLDLISREISLRTPSVWCFRPTSRTQISSRRPPPPNPPQPHTHTFHKNVDVYLYQNLKGSREPIDQIQRNTSRNNDKK